MGNLFIDIMVLVNHLLQTLWKDAQIVSTLKNMACLMRGS